LCCFILPDELSRVLVGDEAVDLIAEFCEVPFKVSILSWEPVKAAYRMKVTLLRETDEMAPSCQVPSSGQKTT